MFKSRPVWGAWIEIESYNAADVLAKVSRPVWGAWIEIRSAGSRLESERSRAPYGARGLK